MAKFKSESRIKTAMDTEILKQEYHEVREFSLRACSSLLPEDFSLQGAVFASPPKWHLAHTSWFFETFLLKPYSAGYCVFDTCFEVLFNSYYNGIGRQHPRAERGLLSRPDLAQVKAYREHVDAAMSQLLSQPAGSAIEDIIARTRLGLEHEKQHQELFFTDIKYSFSRNPLYPELRSPACAQSFEDPGELGFIRCEGGITHIGVNQTPGTFSFDNEGPRHEVYLAPFQLANRLITNAEYQEFMDDGGYRRPELWLADGWAWVQSQAVSKPLYWLEQDEALVEFTLHGLQARQPHAPVCHISGYEADAYACWAGARLPTEFEWEHLVTQQCATSTVHEQSPSLAPLHTAAGSDRPAPATDLKQVFDTCWQWTGSAYRPYPGYQKAAGAIGEYNGKFMCNQWVLKGGSCVTSPKHTRASYRNFFYPEDRWQFTGIRIAK